MDVCGIGRIFLGLIGVIVEVDISFLALNT